MHALRLLFPRHWRPVLSIQNFPHAASLQRQQLILGIFFPETFLYTFILHLPGELIITISSFAHEVWLNSRFSILLAFLNSVFCLSDAILRNSVLILFLLKTYTTWTCCFTLKMILTNLFCFFFLIFTLFYFILNIYSIYYFIWTQQTFLP